MRKYILLVCSILTFFSCKLNQAAAKKDVSSVTTDKLEKALLWKISGKNLKEESYLYGTIHIIDKDDFFYPVGTIPAFESCNKVIFEVDMNDMSDTGKQMEIMKDAVMKDGTSLSDLLSPEDYKIVTDHFEKMGLPMLFFEKMKPMFLSIFASEDINPNDLQTGKMVSYEMKFFELAKAKKMPVAGLETLEFQMSIFDDIPYKDQADMLVDGIKLNNSDGDQFAEMVNTYKAQDISKMIEMFESEDSGLEGNEDILVNERNKNWIPLMEEEMQKQKTFFAVGAGHLAGKQGVIKLLMKEGYNLTPILK